MLYNQEIVERRKSGLGTRATALFLKEGVAALSIVQGVLKEISHVHTDGGCPVHVTLLPQHCIKVLDAGWGQRHGLAGVKALKILTGFALCS